MCRLTCLIRSREGRRSIARAMVAQQENVLSLGVQMLWRLIRVFVQFIMRSVCEIVKSMPLPTRKRSGGMKKTYESDLDCVHRSNYSLLK
jgi:hypothetical protein